MRWWPASAIVACVLVEARIFVDTPNLSEGLQGSPSADTVQYIDERVSDLVIGMGLTLLGLAFTAVFIAGLVRAVRSVAPNSLAAALIAIGGGATVAATFVGYSFNLLLAGAAAEDRALSSGRPPHPIALGPEAVPHCPPNQCLRAVRNSANWRSWKENPHGRSANAEAAAGTAPHLEAVLDRLLVIPDHIVVDVSELTFIDSTGLRLLLRASTLVEGRIWLRGPSRQILRLLEISGLSKSFCLDEDPELAHDLISQRRAG